MDNLAFYIGLGLGLALAAGVRPFLPALLAGGLASGNLLGVDFGVGRYSFLEHGWWLVAVAAALVIAYAVQFAIGSERFDRGVPAAFMAVLSVGAGALLFGGTLCDHGYAPWPGLLGGAAAAILGQVVTRPLTLRVRKRLGDRGAREAVTLYLDGASVAIAAVVSLFHPLGYGALALFAWFAWTGRRRDGGKYAGLRILGR
jgi:hypothetical protein